MTRGEAIELMLSDLHMTARNFLARPSNLDARRELRRACDRVSGFLGLETGERRFAENAPGAEDPTPEPPPAESRVRAGAETAADAPEDSGPRYWWKEDD